MIRAENTNPAVPTGVHLCLGAVGKPTNNTVKLLPKKAYLFDREAGENNRKV